MFPPAGVAQLVEQLIRNQQVTRSSRVARLQNSLTNPVATALEWTSSEDVTRQLTPRRSIFRLARRKYAPTMPVVAAEAGEKRFNPCDASVTSRPRDVLGATQIAVA